MKNVIKTSALALTLAALTALGTTLSSPVESASVVTTTKPGTVTVDSIPVPKCPLNDPNGCNIYK